MTRSSGAAEQAVDLPLPPVDGHAAAPEHAQISGVLSWDVPHVWQDAWAILKPLVEKEFTEAEAFTDIHLARSQLWCVWVEGKMVAAIVTRLMADWPVCLIAYAAGTHGKLWIQPFWRIACEWARAHDRKCMVVAGRRGWQRLLNLRIGGSISDGRPLMFKPLVDL